MKKSLLLLWSLTTVGCAGESQRPQTENAVGTSAEVPSGRETFSFKEGLDCGDSPYPKQMHLVFGLRNAPHENDVRAQANRIPETVELRIVLTNGEEVTDAYDVVAGGRWESAGNVIVDIELADVAEVQSADANLRLEFAQVSCQYRDDTVPASIEHNFISRTTSTGILFDDVCTAEEAPRLDRVQVIGNVRPLSHQDVDLIINRSVKGSSYREPFLVGSGNATKSIRFQFDSLDSYFPVPAGTSQRVMPTEPLAAWGAAPPVFKDVYAICRGEAVQGELTLSKGSLTPVLNLEVADAACFASGTDAHSSVVESQSELPLVVGTSLWGIEPEVWEAVRVNGLAETYWNQETVHGLHAMRADGTPAASTALQITHAESWKGSMMPIENTRGTVRFVLNHPANEAKSLRYEVPIPAMPEGFSTSQVDEDRFLITWDSLAAYAGVDVAYTDITVEPWNRITVPDGVRVNHKPQRDESGQWSLGITASGSQTIPAGAIRIESVYPTVRRSDAGGGRNRLVRWTVTSCPEITLSAAE